MRSMPQCIVNLRIDEVSAGEAINRLAATHVLGIEQDASAPCSTTLAILS